MTIRPVRTVWEYLADLAPEKFPPAVGIELRRGPASNVGVSLDVSQFFAPQTPAEHGLNC